MGTTELASLASATMFLAIAGVAAARRATSPLAVPLALQCIGLFAYSALDVASARLGEAPWDWLEDAAAALSLIPGLYLVLGFIGLGRRLRWLLRLLTAYFAAVALTSLSALVWPEMGAFSGGDVWALLVLGGAAVGYGVAGTLVLVHGRRSQAEERARCNLLFAALLLGVGGAATDLADLAGANLPRLSYAGLLGTGVVLAALVLRAPMFERITAVTAINALVLAVLAIMAQLSVFAWAGARPGLLVFGSLLVVLALSAALRPLWQTLTAERARVNYHATLGRLSRQMAHDIRNPITAIRGAAQFLQHERAKGRPLESNPQFSQFLDLIVERTERLEQVVADYQRMARVEPVMGEVDVNAIVQRALEDAGLSRHERVEIVTELAPDLPACRADSHLLACALENIVRNAVEAMPEGGTLTARTKWVPAQGRRPDTVRIRIRDTGRGMDVRVLERARDEFFTTKSEGSGLGLGYASRVAEAHGGSLHLTSAIGRGTTVELELPIVPPQG